MSFRDRKPWRYTGFCVPPGVVEEDDENLDLGYSILKALSEQTSLTEIAPGVYFYRKEAEPMNMPSFQELQDMDEDALRALAMSMGLGGGEGDNSSKGELISRIMQHMTFPGNPHPDPGE